MERRDKNMEKNMQVRSEKRERAYDWRKWGPRRRKKGKCTLDCLHLHIELFESSCMEVWVTVMATSPVWNGINSMNNKYLCFRVYPLDHQINVKLSTLESMVR